MNLLQIYYRVRQWNKLKNQLTFGEATGKSLVSCFFDSQCLANHYGVSVVTLMCVTN